jgi:hypothetical protein
LIGKQDSCACSATDHADHQRYPNEKTGGKRNGALSPKLERLAILKVLRSKTEQQQEQEATPQADQQKTKAN